MYRLFLILLTAFSTPVLVAQDLHIYYDAFRDSVFYQKNGLPVNQPAVRKGSHVVLHVINYNNYLYDVAVKTDESQTTIAEGSALDLKSMFGGAVSNPGELIFGSGGALGSIPALLGLSKGSGAAATAAEMDRQARIAELEKQVGAFNAAKERLEVLDENIAETQSAVKQALEAQQIQGFVVGELERLRFNPQLEPRQIKKLSQEYMTRIFGETDPNQLDLSKVLQKADAGAEFAKLREDYEKNVHQYGKNVDALKVTSAILDDTRFNFPESNIDVFRKEAVKTLSAAETNLGTYEGNLKTIADKAAGIKSLDVQQLADLRTMYLIVVDNDFSKTHRQEVTTDNMNLQVVLTPVDSINITGVATKYVAPFELNVYGGLHINASLGVSFAQFFDRPQGYFVRDGVISSNKKDAFTPLLTSFVHFYRQGRGAASFGGSFGLGIPLGGSGGLESVTFFLGPSLVLGRGERIVLSGGLMGGKIEQLGQGYAVGDTFDPDPALLQTEQVYRLGYFVGLSFNLLSNRE